MGPGDDRPAFPTRTRCSPIKVIGLGMAAAVLTDALIVRTVLLLALMHTLAVPALRHPNLSGDGKANAQTFPGSDRDELTGGG